MRSFFAFFKKEVLDGIRSGKLLALACIFALLGVMNPAVAKLTPWLLELLSDQLAESGMAVTDVKVDALTSWAQFFKNIPMGLIAFALLFGGSFVREFQSETLVLILTKGLARYKIVLAKAVYLLSVWTLGYWLCFAITYAYNAYFWDNGIAKGLFPAALYFWVLGLFVVSLAVFFSVLAESYGAVLLSTGASVLLLYLLGLLPKLSRISPLALSDVSALLVGAETASAFFAALLVSLLSSVLLIGISIPILNRKQL